MYKDIISYRLAEDVSQEQLLKVTAGIANDWMKNLPGFVQWEVHANSDGTYTDIVYWQSEKDAKNAEKEMANIPNGSDWYGCYKAESISSKRLHQLASYSK